MSLRDAALVHAAQACDDFASASRKMTRPDVLRRYAKDVKVALDSYLSKEKTMTPRSRRRPLVRALVLIAALTSLTACSQGCASLGGAKHKMARSVRTAHEVLKQVDDFERTIKCDAPGAPIAPACIDAALDKELSKSLAEAFRYDQQAANLVAALPAGQPTTPEIFDLAGKIWDLIEHVISQFPKSPQAQAFTAQLQQLE